MRRRQAARPLAARRHSAAVGARLLMQLRSNDAQSSRNALVGATIGVAAGAAVAADSSADSPSDDRAEFVDLLPVPPCRRGETDITSQFTQQAGGGDNPTVTLTPDQGNPSVSVIYIQGPRMQFKNTSMPRNRSRAS